MIPFNSAGAIIATSKSHKHNKEKTPELGISTIIIRINKDENALRIKHDVKNESDWTQAAWALIKLCEEQGLQENLLQLLKDNPKAERIKDQDDQ